MKSLYLKILGVVTKFPNLFSILAVLIFSIFMYGNALSDFYRSDLISGFDGNFHYEIVKKYSENNFPSLYGWIDSWNAGSPWPIAYPPLFTYTFSAFNLVLQNAELAFKLIVIVSTFFIPILILFISKNFLQDKFTQLFVGFWAVFFMVSSENMAGTLGVTILSSLQNGLYPQLFAAVFFLIWFYLFTKYKVDNFPKFFLSSIFLSLTLLANLHVAEPAALIFLVFAFVDILDSKNKLKSTVLYFIYGIFTLGFAGFWIFPLVQTREFFLSRALAQVPVDASIFSIIIWLIAGAIVLIHSIRNQSKLLLQVTISAFAIFLVTILPLTNWFPFLPIQPFRLFPFAYLLCLIITPIAIKIITNKLKVTEYFKLILVLFTIILLIFYSRLDTLKIYDLSSKDKEIIDFLAKTNSRSVIESYNAPDYTPTHTLISSYIPENSSSEVFWGVFRESAFNSPSIVPIRNSVSNFQESFGIACLLCFEYNSANQDYVTSFAAQNLKFHVNRLKLFGVEYVAIHDKNIQIKFITNAQDIGIEQVLSNGDWRIFKIKNVSRAYEYGGKFVGTYTNIKTGDRGMNDIDWHRLNEEWLRLGNFSYLFQQIDSLETDLDKFETIFVNQNLDSSEITKLKSYSENHKIVSLTKFKENLKEIQSVTYLEEDSVAIGSYFDNLFQNNTSFEDNLKPVGFDKSINKFEIKTKDSNSKNLIIAVSYFPWWKSESGKADLVSPGLISINSNKQTIEFQFETQPQIVNIGIIVSMITGIIFVTLLVFGIKWKKFKK